ncbi:PTS system cellobiose-specific IIA component [Spiroplasma sabaudiense Ar-1343]|uniref:PTS system cellobiose-specific IIA component n=1 Tax=Spiroplasma sabaudiense Ar-1343 TaxID=1276257 RepID=W6AKP6_9MOLU|nr:PTS lactose/cellobiose transporter subunit IIA [Spiroplasma sabaudiense]AHI54294.1 PTS system cellobiose-specific IIA component [Spiroplasma sabaudiense Ar-1343]
MNKEKLEEISMGLISNSGMAKSSAMMAIQAAKEKKWSEADQLIKEAQESLATAGQIHMEVIAEEAKGNPINFSPLYMHSEDQMITAQLAVEMAVEIIYLHKNK